MKRQLRNGFAGLALCAAAMTVAPRSAHAYDVTGLGVGADVALGGPSGLALSIGLGRLELDFLVGMTLNLPEGGVLTPGFSAAGGVFFTLTDAEQTNFQLGGRIGTIVQTNGASGTLVDQAAFTVDVLARVEHRFDDHFAINLQVGIGMQIWPDDPNDPFNTQPDFIFGFGNSGLLGGAGFRYWFDGLGGGAPAPVAEPEPVRAEPAAAQPAPATTTTTPTTTEEGGSTPYWEQ